MNRWFACLLVASTLPWGASLGQSSQPLIVRPAAEPCLVVRASPASDASRLACVPPGTLVRGIGTAPYWRRIQLADGTTGWAAKKFLGSAQSDIAIPPTTDIPTNAWLEIHIVDVGQGDGIWIRTFDDGIPDNGRFEGTSIVIDGGPNSADASNSFLKYLRAGGHNGATVDALFISHPHDDHYPGAIGVLRHFDVCNYYDPAYPKGGVEYPAFLDKVRAGRCGSSSTAMHMGKDNFGTLDWGAELTAEILYAFSAEETADLGTGSTLENNSSVVLKLTYGTQSFLFMGDAEGKDRSDPPETPKYVEARLLNSLQGSKLKSTVLKLGHHGSETSSTLPFIRAVDPTFIIASSGRRSYGGTYLPDATTLQRYCSFNPAIRIYRTDQDDEAEGRTSATDNDDDHIVIRTNGQVTMITALSNGVPFSPTGCYL